VIDPDVYDEAGHDHRSNTARWFARQRTMTLTSDAGATGASFQWTDVADATTRAVSAP
jgi:hypothetical protein